MESKILKCDKIYIFSAYDSNLQTFDTCQSVFIVFIITTTLDNRHYQPLVKDEKFKQWVFAQCNEGSKWKKQNSKLG